jgi:hypothetical protein
MDQGYYAGELGEVLGTIELAREIRKDTTDKTVTQRRKLCSSIMVHDYALLSSERIIVLEAFSTVTAVADAALGELCVRRERELGTQLLDGSEITEEDGIGESPIAWDSI